MHENIFFTRLEDPRKYFKFKAIPRILIECSQNKWI